jgi:uncharacterized phage protein gp47/JayE
MSLSTPTTADLSATILAQIQASIGQSVPFLPKAFINVGAKVFAGVCIILYKYVGFVFLQLFVAYASDQPTTINGQVIVPLTELGRLCGVGDPNPALQAQLSITVVVTHMSGSLPTGQALLNSSTGIIYNVVSDVALNAPTVTATIQAVSDQSGGDGSGAIGNMQPGDIIAFANPPSNVAGNATVLSQLVTGADAELTPAYRARITARRQAQPQGGAYADYRAWALDVDGIINVYPYTSATPGVVDVFCEADVVSSGSPDGIPTSDQLTEVLNSINLDDSGLASRRPANAAPNPGPIMRTGFGLKVIGGAALDPVTQGQITDGVDEYLRSREPFIVGLSALPKINRITEAAVSGVVETIVEAAGLSITSVVLTPGPAYDLGNGEKAKLTTPIIWT